MRHAGAAAWAAASILVPVLLGGCAAPQSSALLAGFAGAPDAVSGAPAQIALPHRVSLDATPFFAQEDYQCGPAALAMVLQAAGTPVTPEVLVPEVYLPARQGSLQAEMLAATRRHGLLAYVLTPSLADLLTQIASGQPVVVLQNLSLPVWPRWHYAVAVGYDLGRAEIILRSGTWRELRMTLATFEHTWARSGYWALLALPPGRVPARVDQARYLEASAALERVQPAQARRAYAAALARWPGNALALLGEGNAAYALHDLGGAEQAYRQATRRHPDLADAWNNLAQVLHELGRPVEAREAGRTAVGLGGPRADQYRATLAAIDAADGSGGLPAP